MKESIKMNDYLMELFKFTIGKGNKGLIYPLVKEGIVSEKSVVKTINDADIESEEKSKYALELAKELKDVPIKGLEDIVVNANDVEDIYAFAKYVKWADVNRLSKAIVESKDAYAITAFAREVKGVSVNDLAKEVINLHDGRAIYTFAYSVKGAPIKELEKSMCDPETYNTNFAYDFAKNVSANDVEGLTNAVIKGKSIQDMIAFARDIKGANIRKIENAIIKNGNARNIYEFTKEVPRANKKKLTKAFINSVYYEEENLLCNFALLPKVDLDVINDTLIKKCLDKDIPVSVVTNYVNSLQYHKNLPIDKFTLAVIKRGRPWDIVDFARNTENVQVDELADALIQMECREKKYWLYEFMLKVKNAPISKLNEAFKKESKKSMLKVQYSEEFLKILRLVRNKDIEGLRKYKDLLNEDKLTKKLK